MAVIHVTNDTFEQEVLQAKEPVLVDFWATWCGPCQMVGPIIEEIAEEKDNRLRRRAYPYRTGGGIRLLYRTCGQNHKRVRLRIHHHQQQPGNRFHGLHHLRQAVL